MANRVYITVKQEKTLNEDFEPKDERIKVYINCDEMTSCLGELKALDKKELLRIAGPNNIRQQLQKVLSETELNHFMSLLSNSPYYWIDNTQYKMV